MKKYKIILLVMVVLLAGCTKSKNESSALPADFVNRFNRLFLSEEPLRYQDNVAILKAIKIEQLNLSDQKIIRIKIKIFFSHGCQNRDYAKDSWMTGVASPCAFLRLQSIQLFGDVGENADVKFIEGLREQNVAEHPLFKEGCNKAIEKIKNR